MGYFGQYCTSQKKQQGPRREICFITNRMRFISFGFEIRPFAVVNGNHESHFDPITDPVNGHIPAALRFAVHVRLDVTEAQVAEKIYM
jgi:hypothetical protein